MSDYREGLNRVELFFFNDTATTEIYTLSLHDALPISIGPGHWNRYVAGVDHAGASDRNGDRRQAGRPSPSRSQIRRAHSSTPATSIHRMPSSACHATSSRETGHRATRSLSVAQATRPH